MSLPLSTVVPTPLFHDGPFRWRTAARRTDEAGWLQFDLASLDEELAQKAAILTDDRADAFVAEPGSDVPADEVRQLIDDALAQIGRGPVATDERHPLERAALAVHEDLILMGRRPRGWVMVAGAVCFPTRWSPAEKIGRTMEEIHGPVPRYDTIAPAVGRLFDRLAPGSIVWRPNWSIVGQSALRLPVEDRQAPAALPGDPASELWLRVERQTVRRLDDHDDHIVFTVRVHRWPLGEVLDELDLALVAELRSLPDDVATYKNLERWRNELADRVEAGVVG